MAAEALVRFKGDKKHLDNTVRSVKGDLTSIAKAGGAAVLGLGAATGAFGVASVKSFAAFDDAMNSSLAIMGDVDSTLQGDMKQAAMDLSSTMRISSTEAAEAYFYLASAGIDAEQQIDALAITATFAQAGMFDMSLATDLLTDAQSALGLSVDDTSQNMENMTRVSDVLVKSNTLANATVQQFSEALTNGAGAALKVVGKDVEEGAAVLAAFADQGVKGAEAGTQFGIVMRDLQTKALKNKEAFAEMGVSVFDSQGEMKNMAAIIGDLEDAMGGMSDEASKQFLLDLGFTDKSVKSIQTLLGTSDKIREYEEALRDAGGVSQEVADKQAQSFSAQMEIIGNKFENLKIKIGTKIAPFIIEAFDRIGEWWDRNGDKIIAKVTEFWADFQRGSEIVSSTASKLWEDFQRGWDQLSAGASVLWEWLTRLFDNGLQALSGLWNMFKGIFTGDINLWASGVKDLFAGLWHTLWQLAEAGLKLLWEGIKAAWHLATLAFGHVFGKVKTWMSGWWDEFTGDVGTGIDRVIGVIRGAASNAYDAARNLGRNILNGITNGISGAVSFITDLASTIGSALKNYVNRNVIDKINRGLEFDISFFGYTQSINPPDIPRLARGGVLDSPTLIVAGDSPGESEIVSPESKMKAAFAETLSEMGGGGGSVVGTLNVYNQASPDQVINAIAMAARTRRF